MKRDLRHVQIRDLIEFLLAEGSSVESISNMLGLPIGSRYSRYSVLWYKYYIIAKRNQKIAIEKHPNLYSKAGKIAQQRHPWIGIKLGKKYGHINGKKNAERLRGNSKYFSKMAKKLQQKNPDHSRRNMLKAHKTMKRKGTFHDHQREAALSCRIKNPNQLKDISKKAHRLHPLALLALESRRKNMPYRFMNCLFDSNSEIEVCKRFVQESLICQPIEGKNIHFRIKRHHIDFLIKGKIFVEFHPPIQYGRKKGETAESYFKERRSLLDANGFKKYPLVVISSIKELDLKVNEIKSLLDLVLDH